MNPLLSSLNPQQQKGVEKVHGPLLVIAGAGSGKTKMLTARIAHLMTDHQVSGHNILAVTFTNKAAEEMRSRIANALGMSPEEYQRVSRISSQPWLANSLTGGPAYSLPTIGTFHSVCVRLLRQEIKHTPYSGQFTILDDSDQLQIVKSCLAQIGISDKMISPRRIQWAINAAKCDAVEPQTLPEGDHDFFAKIFKQAYELYQRELFKANAIDFGEILTMAYRVIRDNPEVLEKYQNLYQYIHVDEYQDTNRSQYLFVTLLAQKHRHLCVVGDEDQSIYKWRGADIRNILDFEKDYKDAAVVKLEQNYRSSQTIIQAASELISNNSSRKPKTLWTQNEVGPPIRRYHVSDERTEAELVIGKIKSLCSQEGFSYNDCAIFYRTNAQSRILEDVLRREKIPYKIWGGLKFYDRKEIKDVLAYFRVLVNDKDSVSLKRIINVPQRAIGKTTVDKVDEHALRTGVSFFEALKDPALELGAGPKRKIQEFVDLLFVLRELAKEKGLSEFYREMLDQLAYVRELREEGTEEALARIENLQELDSTFADFEESLGQSGLSAVSVIPFFLETVSLAAESETQEAYSPSGVVSLMTLHTSKGLEYPVVFMVGLEEGLFPSLRGDQGEVDDSDLEEERRLCYVGMTRAKKELYMTSALCRRVYGNIVYHEPARFFQEIPESLVEFEDLTRFRMGASAGGSSYASPSYSDSESSYSVSSQPSWKADPYTPRKSYSTSQPRHEDEGVQIGLQVRHGVFGLGVIREVEGYGDNAKVTVEFAGRNIKKLVYKFAKLERV